MIIQAPTLDDLPLCLSKAEAGVTLSKAKRRKLISSPRVRQVKQLVEIAHSFAQDRKLLGPPLTREFIEYIFSQLSVTLTMIVFIDSTVLDLVSMYVCHQFNHSDRIFQNRQQEKSYQNGF